MKNNKYFIRLLVVLVPLVCFSQTSVSSTITGEISSGSEVDYVSFSFNSPGDLIIDVLAFEGRNDDFFGTGAGKEALNSEIHLFKNDLSGQLIASNDDSGFEGSNDGSTKKADSFLFLMALAAGDYILAIADQKLSESDARNGVNNGSLNPSRVGKYQITLTGNVSVNTINTVPAPNVNYMLLVGLFLFMLVRIKANTSRFVLSA